jgi:prepilin-type N-terminal cleavage/methylation domain-containing protein
MLCRSNTAFTLIELMIVIAIIGVALASFSNPVRFAWARLNRGQQIHEDTDTILALKRYLDKDLANLAPGIHLRWSPRYDVPGGHELNVPLPGAQISYLCTAGTVTRSSSRKESPPRVFSRLTLTSGVFGNVRNILNTANDRPGLPVLVSLLEEP